jgi:hypothetical protein
MPDMWLFFACTQPPEVPADPPTPGATSTPESSDTPTDSTAPTGSGDTGGPDRTGDGLYPSVPYDCSAPLAQGPIEATIVEGTRTTEDVAFTPDGLMVSNVATDLLSYAADGSLVDTIPAVGEGRGFDVLPDGHVVFTEAVLNQLVSLDRQTGVTTTLASFSGSPGQIDVGADGSVYVAGFGAGSIRRVDPTGTKEEIGGFIGPVGPFGIALSPDEQTLYVVSWGREIYRLQRGPDGWGAPEPWVAIPGGYIVIPGVATDACGNVYVTTTRCALYRATPEGEVAQLGRAEAIDIGGGTYGGGCSSISFGRAVGGWDPLAVYFGTYGQAAAIRVGLPGRPR